MKIVTTAQMKQAEEETCRLVNLSMRQLMECAGERVAENVLDQMELRGKEDGFVLVLAGRGNNGGDALVAARHLAQQDMLVLVLLAGEAEDLRGDVRAQYELLKEMDIRVIELSTQEDWHVFLSMPPPCDAILDGLLGTGVSGPPRGPLAAAIEFINQQSSRTLVFSIDVPSGLNADTGEAPGPVVKADFTMTMGLPKTGLVLKQAARYVGVLDVLDIGIPYQVVDALESTLPVEITNVRDMRGVLPRRETTSHKGNFGHVLIMAGARGYSGAATLAAYGALSSGAGLVTVLVPESIEGIVAVATPEIMVRGMPENEIGAHTPGWWNDWRNQLDAYDALLVGPGMTRHNDTLLLLRQIIRDCRIPLVLDADAISVFAGKAHWMEKASCPLILTPHPGECSALFGQPVETIQADRIKAAQSAADETKATIVLKGAQTVVAQPQGTAFINTTGNPGLATGGTGDVLAGMITALLAQGLDPVDAARLAVFVHGYTADAAATMRGQVSLTASVLLRELPNGFLAVQPH
jgi:ADP-dependent NAD(P)H-hydrate dehydratase / NAD(P)H-hydrate epimerase